MSALDFPTTGPGGRPLQSGDQYVGDNGVTYIYDGVKWIGHSSALPPGTSALVNSGHVFQIDGAGNLVAPSYIFPVTSGTTNQVLVWPGSGHTLVWQNQSGTGSSFTVTNVSYFTNDVGYLTSSTVNRYVTSSSAISWQLTSSTSILSLASSGILTLPTNGVITDSNNYLTTRSINIQGYLKGVDGSTGTTSQVLTRQSNGGVAWANAQGGGTPWQLTSATAILKVASDNSVTLPNGAKLDGGSAYKFATDNGVTQYIDLRDTTGRGFYTDSSGYTLRSNGSNNWIFDTTGVLTIPGNIQAASGHNVLLKASSGHNIGLISSNNSNTFYVNDIAAYVQTIGNNTNLWTFKSTGTLVTPTNGVLGDTYGDGGLTLQSPSAKYVELGSNDGNAYMWIADTGYYNDSRHNAAVYISTDYNNADYRWTFNSAGKLTLPDLGDILDINGNSVIHVATTSTAPARVNGQLWFNIDDARTYIKYNDQWVDASPTQIPDPSTYLDDIEIDGSTILINNSTLTIDLDGVLLVNGEQVTGSGSGGDRLTTGSDSLIYTAGGSLITTSSLYVSSFGTSTYSAFGWADSFVDATKAAGIIANSPFDPSTGDLFIYTGDVYGPFTNQIWTFGHNGVLTLSTASTILGAGTDPNVYIETVTTSTTSIWAFGTNGVLTLPAATPVIKGAGSGTDVTVVATTGSNTATWVFGANAELILPTGYSIGGNDASKGITLTTGRGTIQFGGYPEFGGPAHFHIMKDAPADVDLFFGDDYNYVRQRPAQYGLDPAYGVEIGTNSLTTGSSQQVWRFDTTGTITFPDATVQRTAYLSGQQTVYLNTASTSTSIDITDITSTLFYITTELGYTNSGETHYITLPFGVGVGPAVGTKVRFINIYNGTVEVTGWPAPGYPMTAGETIELIYYYDPVSEDYLWWVTNTFNW